MDKRCHRRRHPAKIQKGNALLRHSPCDCSICKSADLPYVHSAYHLDVLASGSDFSAFPADHACESPAENMENAKPSVRRPAAGTLCGIKTGRLRKKSPFSPVFPAKYHQYRKCPVAASKVQRAWDFLSDRCLLRAGLLACSCMDRPPAGFRHQYGQ